MFFLGKHIFGPLMLLWYLSVLAIGAVFITTCVNPIDDPSSPAVDSVSWHRALMIATDIGTGANPTTYEKELHTYYFLWVGSWIVHVVGWILVPAVIGYVVSVILVRLRETEARRRREAILRELADDQRFTDQQREAFDRIVLPLLAEHEEFLFGKRG